MHILLNVFKNGRETEILVNANKIKYCTPDDLVFTDGDRLTILELPSEVYRKIEEAKRGISHERA